MFYLANHFIIFFLFLRFFCNSKYDELKIINYRTLTGNLSEYIFFLALFFHFVSIFWETVALNKVRIEVKGDTFKVFIIDKVSGNFDETIFMYFLYWGYKSEINYDSGMKHIKHVRRYSQIVVKHFHDFFLQLTHVRKWSKRTSVLRFHGQHFWCFGATY